MTTKQGYGGSSEHAEAPAVPDSQTDLERPDEILDRLRVCLQALRTTHDLGRRELRVTERAIRKLDHHGMATTANEFWATTALPRSQQLVTESKRVIDRELVLLANHHPKTDPDLAIGALPSTTEINDLGAWWQRRLRRAAQLRSIYAIATNTPGRSEFLIANKEMLLLDRPPWSHGDRLLSAFELAHGQIARYGRQRVDELFTDSAAGSNRADGPDCNVGDRDLLVESAPN